MFSAKDLRPMLATLPSQAPSLTDKSYVYEPKVDGIRAIVEVLPRLREDASAGKLAGLPGRQVRFWSRNGNEKTAVPRHRRRHRELVEENQVADSPRRRNCGAR